MPRPTRIQAARALIDPRVGSQKACRDWFAAFLGRRADGFIRVEDFVGLLTVSPAGGGKSVNSLVPNLLSYGGNAVVVDPKGELFALTHAHRREHFGHEIVRLDPGCLYDDRHGPGDCLNALDWIDPNSPRFIDSCRDLANMIVVRSGMEHEPHWNDSAENVIAALTAFICACEGNPDERNLRGVRTYLASRQLYGQALSAMQEREDFRGVLQQLGHSLTWHVDKELGSVMSHTQRHTNIFDSPLIATATRRTTFDPRSLRGGKMTVYIIIPSDMLAVWAAVQRLWLGTLLRVATRGVPTEENPVLFMIDEAAHIGQMRALEDAVTLMRGMGVRCWFFFQSLDQLKRTFGDHASTILDNLATRQYFSINSYETAEALSKEIGEETIAVRSDNESDNTSIPMGGGGQPQPGSRSWGRGSTISEQGRALLKPEEVLRLPGHVSLLFHKNMRPILAERISYYSDPAFRLGRRGYGTGLTRGPGLGSLAGALAILLAATIGAAVAACLPPAVEPRPRASRPAFAPASPGDDDDPYDSRRKAYRRPVRPRF
ncbi:type IV secretory system conjugative DNA transfer family protein [Singulisphaera sp. PoT]|uniref:type IV secretory system conjugative DNA transfer family protein n=1 Tax=Singulisphaera sp. PoT TaxID=3411797 RepID=UPI003BF499AC